MMEGRTEGVASKRGGFGREGVGEVGGGREGGGVGVGVGGGGEKRRV